MDNKISGLISIKKRTNKPCRQQFFRFMPEYYNYLDATVPKYDIQTKITNLKRIIEHQDRLERYEGNAVTNKQFKFKVSLSSDLNPKLWKKMTNIKKPMKNMWIHGIFTYLPDAPYKFFPNNYGQVHVLLDDKPICKGSKKL